MEQLFETRRTIPEGMMNGYSREELQNASEKLWDMRLDSKLVINQDDLQLPYLNDYLFPINRRTNMVIRPDGFKLNKLSLDWLGCEFIRIRVDEKRRRLFLEPCDAEELVSIRCGRMKNGVIRPCKATSKLFGEWIYHLMGWNPGYSFKALAGVGRIEGAGQIRVLVVDLELTMKSPLTARGRELAGVTDEQVGEEELAKINEIFRMAEEERRIAKEKGKRTGAGIKLSELQNGNFLISADRINTGTIGNRAAFEGMQDWSVLAERQQGIGLAIDG